MADDSKNAAAASSSGGEGAGKLQAGSPTEPAAFGKYYLLGLIARGGMAEVYRARPRKDAAKLLAIKCMRPQLAREARFVDMFIREGKLALMLRHPSIVGTSDVGRIEGRYFIAMEYIGGKDLTQVLRRCQEDNKRIPVPHAVFIAARIAEGLDYAHRLQGDDGRPLNIVNRDVSPSNVRISYDGEVKLLDFGIAQALMKFTSEIGVLKGKFSYMSPEQIRGMPVDARTDIFSAGIILHEMLTTEKLFRGDTEFALMEKVRKAEVPAPSNFNRRVTPEIDQIVLKALARDVADRYQSAAALAADLDALIAGYRFDPKELRQFMRQLFRKEYAKEIEETQQALESKTLDEVAAENQRRAATAPADLSGPTATTGGAGMASTPTAPRQKAPSAPPASQPAAPIPPTNPPTARGTQPPPVQASPEAAVETTAGASGESAEEKKGFFASLFKRKK
jgi:serine/threonine protein kinase